MLPSATAVSSACGNSRSPVVKQRRAAYERAGVQGLGSRQMAAPARLASVQRELYYRISHMTDTGSNDRARPNWALILGLLTGVAVALAIFIPALVVRPSPKPTAPLTSISTSAPAAGRIDTVTIPGPLGGPDISRDVNTLVGQRAPGFTLSDSEGVSYPISPGGGTPTVLIFNMGVT